MTISRLPWLIATVLLCGCAALPAPDPTSSNAACTAASLRTPADPRIQHAVAEARRQHQLFGGQTIERDGGMFRVGFHEAEWARPAGESAAAWERVATFWTALFGSDVVPPSVLTSVGRVARGEAAAEAASGGEVTRAQVALDEALLRAALIDTPWSAVFISYLMKTAGFAGTEFAFSDSHSDYVQGALATSAAEAAGQAAPYAFRACDVATTRPRAGDLLCATRAGTAVTTRFDALAAAMSARRANGQPFPMHCDLVVRSDEGGDARLETIGGNVINSVTLSRMALDANKVLSDAYRTGPADASCESGAQACRGHLSRRPWLVLLQFRG